MTHATMKNINEAIAKHGLEVVKGKGYFYFADTSEAFVADRVPSVWSAQLRCLSLEGWVEHVEAALAATAPVETPAKEAEPMINLTNNEIQVLFTICDNPESAIHDTGSTWTDAKEIAKNSGLPLASVIGVLGSLTKKDLIYVEDEVNGRKQDICCISEFGCETMMKCSSERIVEAQGETIPKEEPVGFTIQTDNGPVAPRGAEAADDLANAMTLAFVNDPLAFGALVACGWSKSKAMRFIAEQFIRKGHPRTAFMAEMIAQHQNGSTAAGAWNAVLKGNLA